MSLATHIDMTEDNVSGLRRVRFQLKVDDEIVPGLLQIPDKEGPFPLVFIQHPGLASKDEIYISGTAKKWAEQYGWACVALDAPGHGERAIENALDALRDAEKASIMSKQFAKEITVTIDTLANEFPINMRAIGYWGFSLGALLGVQACALDQRFRASVLAAAGTSPLTGKLTNDVLKGLQETAILLLAKTEDEVIPKDSTESLFSDIQCRRKELRWLPGGHFMIGGDVITEGEMWLNEELAVKG
ncbi:uncharacterized protein METZ01_LOCUS400655 [marine metagenome]|uniref:Phospholipase/carboxylesterase/thioesterase domain-containing protein n=1 Tax=marine metagenome TaxID=408172 RepID=A0A382VPE8_9ZZZZ